MFFRKKEITKMTSINVMVSWGLDSMSSNQKASVAKKGRGFLRGKHEINKIQVFERPQKDSPGSST